MYSLYRVLTLFASPLVPGLLQRRLARGKEDGARLPERLGRSSLARPTGQLVWIHAASIGEANAALPLIEALLGAEPKLNILLTTVTVTSAALMVTRLPDISKGQAFHQFAPVDTPAAVGAFLAHWKPDVALWVDSELWPNLIMQTWKSGAVMGIINARMSERSFKRWRLVPFFIRPLLACFSVCFAQSETDGARLTALGLSVPACIGNLKYDSAPLPCGEAELAQLRAAIGERAVWLAASTHPGEEAILAGVYLALKGKEARPLAVIVPRHARRGDEIAAELDGFTVARRSKGEPITPQTDLYLADTMGELGLFYRLAPLVFMGGTLVAHGGQNPLEPAKLGCAIIAGPHMENFASIATEMQQQGAIVRVQDAAGLARELERLLGNPQEREKLGANALKHIGSHEGISVAITQELRPFIA